MIHVHLHSFIQPHPIVTTVKLWLTQMFFQIQSTTETLPNINNPHGMGVTKTVLSFDILSVTKHVKRNPFYTGELFDFRKKIFFWKKQWRKNYHLEIDEKKRLEHLRLDYMNCQQEKRNHLSVCQPKCNCIYHSLHIHNFLYYIIKTNSWECPKMESFSKFLIYLIITLLPLTTSSIIQPSCLW